MLGTVLTMAVALCAGYALASKHFPFPKLALVFVLIPMYFSGGLIPFYVIVNKYGLNNTIFALVFPYLVSVFYILVFRNVISGMPEELMQSAEIDGACEPDDPLQDRAPPDPPDDHGLHDLHRRGLLELLVLRAHLHPGPVASGRCSTCCATSTCPAVHGHHGAAAACGGRPGRTSTP